MIEGLGRCGITYVCQRTTKNCLELVGCFHHDRRRASGRETNLGGITATTNKKLTTEMITLDSHSRETITMYVCAKIFFFLRHALCVWWTMVTAVKTAHAVENPNKKVTIPMDRRDGVSGSYHAGIRKPPMLLGVGIIKHEHTYKYERAQRDFAELSWNQLNPGGEDGNYLWGSLGGS